MKMKNFKNRLLLIVKEVVNFLLNVLVPVVSLLILIMELLPFIPIKWIDAMKKFEYYAFKYSGTAEKISERLEEKYKELEEKRKNKK